MEKKPWLVLCLRFTSVSQLLHYNAAACTAFQQIRTIRKCDIIDRDSLEKDENLPSFAYTYKCCYLQFAIINTTMFSIFSISLEI